MATESQLTISPPNCWAKRKERAVLPLAVGPRMTTSNGSDRTLSLFPPVTSAPAPVNIVPVANQREDQQYEGDQDQPDRLGGIHAASRRLTAWCGRRLVF